MMNKLKAEDGKEGRNGKDREQVGHIIRLIGSKRKGEDKIKVTIGRVASTKWQLERWHLQRPIKVTYICQAWQCHIKTVSFNY